MKILAHLTLVICLLFPLNPHAQTTNDIDNALLELFYIAYIEELTNLTPETITTVPTELFSVLESDILFIPPAAFAGISPAQIAALDEYAILFLTVEQFSAIPDDSLKGFRAAQIFFLNAEIFYLLTPEELAAFDPNALQQADGLTTLLTNLDPVKIPLATFNALNILPDGWAIDPDTYEITVPVGADLFFKTLEFLELTDLDMPEIFDFTKNLTYGGIATKNSLLAEIEAFLDVIDGVEEDLFEVRQDEEGLLIISLKNADNGVEFAFLIDPYDTEQTAPLANQNSANLDAKTLEITTATGKNIQMIGVPREPSQLLQLAKDSLGAETKVKVGENGEVYFLPPAGSTQLDSTPRLVKFDYVVEKTSEPAGIYWDKGYVVFANAPQGGQRQLREQDNSKQKIALNGIPNMQAFENEAKKLGATDIKSNLDNTIALRYGQQSFLLTPINTSVTVLAADKRVATTLDVRAAATTGVVIYWVQEENLLFQWDLQLRVQ